MIIKTSYICEYCGEQFTNEEECQEHEVQEKVKDVKDKIKYFNCEGSKLPLTASPSDIDYFWAMDEQAFEFVNNYFYECGYDKPLITTNYRTGEFYYEDDGCWYNVDDLKDKQNKILNVFYH